MSVSINGVLQTEAKKDALTEQAEKATIESAETSRAALRWAKGAFWIAVISLVASVAALMG